MSQRGPDLQRPYHASQPPTVPAPLSFRQGDVPPSMRTARQAVAWTFGLPAAAYDPVVET